MEAALCAAPKLTGATELRRVLGIPVVRFSHHRLARETEAVQRAVRAVLASRRGTRLVGVELPDALSQP